jgi:hypothetical protein
VETRGNGRCNVERKCFLVVFCLVAASTTAALAQLQQVWEARYDHGDPFNMCTGDRVTALAIDASGNVYVTGWSGYCLMEDYATVKYGPDGKELWAARHNGSWDGWDMPGGFAVDAEGNVFVTGMESVEGGRNAATIKYGPDGQRLWVAYFDKGANDGGNAVALDGAGNIYVAARADGGEEGGGYNYGLIKYAPDGTQIWAALYDGPGAARDFISSMAMGPDGNILLTGKSTNAEQVYDIATLKYDPEGKQLWVARFAGPALDDSSPALAVDKSGNVYVAGAIGASREVADLVVVKYGPSGNELWSARYGGPAGGEDRGTDVAVDDSGNVYVCGRSWGGDPAKGGTDYDCILIKYDSDGKTLWIARHDGPTGGADLTSQVVVDASQDVYVTGYVWNGDPAAGGTGADYVTMKYSPMGEALWVAPYDGPGSKTDTAQCLAVDASGGVYIAGTSYGGPDFSVDFAVVKYLQPPAGKASFLRGDGDSNGVLDIEDSRLCLAYLFNDAKEPICLDALDVNDDGAVNIADPIYSLNFLSFGAPEIPSPGLQGCEPDPTEDNLTCDFYSACK